MSMGAEINGPLPPEVFNRAPVTLDLFEADNRMIRTVKLGATIFGSEMAGVVTEQTFGPTPPSVDKFMLASSAVFLIAVASTAAIHTFSELHARFRRSD